MDQTLSQIKQAVKEHQLFQFNRKRFRFEVHKIPKK